MRQPNHLDLVNLWMTAHHSGRACAVFFDPLGDGFRPQKIAHLLGLSNYDTVRLCTSDIYITEVDAATLCSFVNRLDEDIYGYVAAWDGEGFVTENT